MIITKNPLALAGGAAIMLFGIALGIFFGYNIFFEQKVYRSNNKAIMGEVIRKEKQEIFADALSTKPIKKPETKDEGLNKTTDTASTENGDNTTSTKSTAKTTETTYVDPPVRINYKLHYAFTPAGATTPVTSVLKTTERLFNAMKEKDKVEILYNKEKPKEDHRPLFPYKFGQSFYLGVAALLGGAFFITYLGWCFIFPEE